ncbi:uncharacterized protein LOC114123731 [Aphis gossypii]|uniref:uncharacterized protein LOC114123731 n=1 Tax=Aphis gossypii TaxID=80765 RepID=UPI00100DC528|nr:uncharacterized protein LOC114123731 [Aphis gossypii]
MADRRVTWYAATLSAIIISVAAGIGNKGGLILTKLIIPQWADLRSSVTLHCQFNTGGDSLYSVKWYKDDHEFFRYTPGLNPQTLVFDMDGVNVDESKSSASEVTLFPLTRLSNGNYKCEVSTDAPNFPTVVEDANMTVIAYPEDGPRIEGLRQMYSIGEFLEANCTAKMTFPVAEVSWFVNDILVESYLLERYNTEVSEGPFYNSTLGLRYPLKKEWLDMNKKQVVVKCTAKVGKAEPKTDETIVRLRLVPDQTLSQERHILNAGAAINNHCVIILIISAVYYYEVYN